MAIQQIIKVSQTIQLPSPTIPNVSSSTAGLVPTAPNDALQELNGAGVWSYQAPWQRYNAIRNPEMIVAQRGVGPAAPASNLYTIDGWELQTSGPTCQWSQIAVAIPPDASGNNWYPYTAYAYRITVTASAAMTGGNYCWAIQYVEGLMAEKLKDNPTSISLLVRASITGIFSVTLRDSANAWGYTIPVNIPTANVWQRVALPNIPTFTSSGTFPNGNVNCYQLGICIGVGTTYAGSPANTWIPGNIVGAAGMSNFCATNGNTFDFTLVQHEPNPVCTPYVKRELADEYALNYRYLWIFPSGFYLGWVYNASWTAGFGKIIFPATMRIAPTVGGGTFAMPSGSAGTVALGWTTPTMGLLYNSAGNWAPTAFNSLYATVQNLLITAEI